MTDLEMTRLLAEKVLQLEGLEVRAEQSDLREAIGRHLAGPRRYFTSIHWCGLVGEGSVTYPWNPTERIEHAWEVRDKLAEQGAFFVANRFEGHTDAWYEPWEDGREAEASDRTAARAICLCALRAVGEEV